MRLFIESDSDRVELGSSSRNSTYVRGRQSSGFGVPKKVSRLVRGAGPGASYRGTRTDTRTADVQVFVYGADRLGTEAAIRRLANVVAARSNAPLPKLVAEYADGSAFELPFVYQSGLELEGSASWEMQTEVMLSIECPAPYWTARDALQFSVMNTADPVGLLPDLAELNVMGSTAIGSIEVTNPGDVESNISWVITGPGGPVPISVNGVGFTFATPLVLGEVITIQRTALGVSVTDQAGANRYASLGSAPKFPRLPSGVSTVNISMAGASSGTRIATTDVEATNRVVSPALRTVATGWSTFSTSATATRASTGFSGGTDGFMQLQWTAGATAEAAFRVDVAAVEGESLSGSMSVRSSVAQAVMPTAQFVDGAGAAVGPLFVGVPVEVPASTAVVIGFSADDLGVAPVGTAGVRFMASVDAVSGQTWPSGATFQASRAIVSDVPMAYFDGASLYAGWTGTANASTSTLFRTVIVGQSSVAGFFKPRREVIY